MLKNKLPYFLPLANPSLDNAKYFPSLEKKIINILRGDKYILGKEVSLFQKNFARYCNSKFCLGTSSGTDSILLALKALNIKENDKVITAPNAGYYSTLSIKAQKAIPIYVDIDPNSMTISNSSIEKILDENKVKCIVITHLFGFLANLDPILKLASKHNIPIIEDCAQAHGAKFKGKVAGTFGDIGTYSFYPTKNLGAIGDAGALITNKKDIYEALIKLYQYGWGDKYYVDMPFGQNSRMDEMQAGILNVKLKKIDKLNVLRKKIVNSYAAVNFNNLSVHNFKNDNFVAHMAIVRTKYRNKLKKYLLNNNIGCDIHYPILDYQQHANLIKTQCNNAEQINKEILSIPCYPSMKSQEVNYVISVLKNFDSDINAQYGKTKNN